MSSWIGKALFANQLEALASTHLKQWGGVLASNQLERVKPATYPTAYIVNTDPEDRPGQHWTVWIAESPQHWTYFDSYGLSPFTTFPRFAENVRYDTRWLQSQYSLVCGHYCLYYLCHRFHYRVPWAMNFRGSRVENDRYVLEWCQEHYPHLSIQRGQSCQSLCACL